jgi:ribosomal-protein-alanine N-acetyltransferase
MRLRDYRPADFDELWRLDQRCFPPGIAYSRSELRAGLALPTAEAIVAEHEGRVVAFVLGSRPRRADAHLITLDVDASVRRRGLGRRLLTAIEDRFRRAGVRRISLETAADNTAAISLYERLGYRKRRYVAGYYGPGLDAWRMDKRVDSRGEADGSRSR